MLMNMLNPQTPKEKEILENSLYNVDTMICGCCGYIICKKEPGTLFDVWDKSWTCDLCKALWLSSDGWDEQENYLIPYR